MTVMRSSFSEYYKDGKAMLLFRNIMMFSGHPTRQNVVEGRGFLKIVLSDYSRDDASGWARDPPACVIAISFK
jgi:hypothetical protein